MNCFQSKYSCQILINAFKGTVLVQFPTNPSIGIVFQGSNKTTKRFCTIIMLGCLVWAQGYLGVTYSFVLEENEFKKEITKHLSGRGLHHPRDIFSKTNRVILALAESPRKSLALSPRKSSRTHACSFVFINLNCWCCSASQIQHRDTITEVPLELQHYEYVDNCA